MGNQDWKTFYVVTDRPFNSEQQNSDAWFEALNKSSQIVYPFAL